MLRINTDETPKQVTKDPKRHETGVMTEKTIWISWKGILCILKLNFIKWCKKEW